MNQPLPSADGAINAGEDLLDGLAALCAHRGMLRGVAVVLGEVKAARLRPAPGAAVVTVDAAGYLSATAAVDPGGINVIGQYSWVDAAGLPRSLSGAIVGALSAGCRAQLFPAAAAASADPPIDAPRPPARGRTEQVAAARIDLSADAPEPATRPAATRPAKKPPKKPTGGGWGAAVAASQSAPRRARSSGDPTPDQLGFDAAPTLRAGDVLLHPRFGRCTVSRNTGPDKVKVRRESGGLFDLGLRVCRFSREADDDSGHRVFRLTIGRH